MLMQLSALIESLRFVSIHKSIDFPNPKSDIYKFPSLFHRCVQLQTLIEKYQGLGENPVQFEENVNVQFIDKELEM